MDNFLKTVHQLEELKNSLVRDNESISAQLQDAISKIKESKTDIEQGALKFDSVTKELAETNEALLKSNDELMMLHEKFQAKLASLAQMEASFQEQLTTLQCRVAMDETRSRLYATDMTLNSQISVNEEDDALILAELAMKEFDIHMAEIAIYKQESTHRSASMRFFTNAPPSEINESRQPSPHEF